MMAGQIHIELGLCISNMKAHLQQRCMSGCRPGLGLPKRQCADVGPSCTRPTRAANRMLPCKAVLADKPPSFPNKSESVHKVAEFMTKGTLLTVGPETPLDTALEILVRHDVTGLPVVGDDGRVVGVVSDFDLLSMDAVSGKMQTTGMFPNITTDWGTFHEVQKLLVKNEGRVVGDVMTPDPFVVREFTDFKTAARILLDRKIRRLPVVDGDGRLVGIFSRKDVIRAALELRNEVK